MKNRNFFYLVCAVILGFGLYVIAPERGTSAKDNKDSAVTQAQEIRYQGKDGATALDLLKEQYQVQTQASELGEYVTSINGITAGDNQFWAFYVNGQLSTVGADSYTTTNSDEVLWKLEKF